MNWKYTDATRRVAFRILPSGSVESRLALDLSQETIDPPDLVVPHKDEVDKNAMRQDPLVQAVARMTPADVDAYIVSTFPGLTAAQRRFLFVCGVSASIVARSL